jgi:hypothetical protein
MEKLPVAVQVYSVKDFYKEGKPSNLYKLIGLNDDEEKEEDGGGTGGAERVLEGRHTEEAEADDPVGVDGEDDDVGGQDAGINGIA